VVHSRNNESMEADHKVNLPKKPATIFLDDNEAVLFR